MVSQNRGARILVVDDEPAIQRALRTIFTRHGFQVELAENAQQARESYLRQRPDLVLLDLGLPDADGLVLIEELRSQGNTPIVVVSVRGAERDKVAALDLGADDYLTKPFGVDELLARIRVALRHAAGPSKGSYPVFRTGSLEVDLERRGVKVGGQEVRLSPMEYQLLKAFVSHPNRVLTHRMILQEVWGSDYGSEYHYLHVYVARLRKKIEVDPQKPRYLVTEPGVGYRLLAEDS